MMDRISTIVLVLDGMGHAQRFADYSQTETWQRLQDETLPETAPARNTPDAPPAPVAKRKLSYIAAREFATIEERIAAAEQTLQTKRAALEDPEIASDGARLMAISAEIEEAHRAVD